MANIVRLLSDINLRCAATETSIAKVQEQLGLNLPADYVAFLRRTNGGEGFVGQQYVIFWGVDELPSMNCDYEVEMYAPGLLVFGSSGGGEAYGFDTRSSQWPVVSMPFVGMEWEVAEPMGPTFDAFLERLYETRQ